MFFAAILLMGIINFSGKKVIMSFERPCSPDYFLTKDVVLRQPRFHVINTYIQWPLKNFFRHYDFGIKAL